MNNYNKIINKTIVNTTNKDKYFEDILLLKINDLKELNIGTNDVRIFRSARHKNDMPTIFKLGEDSDSFKDATTKIAETGSSLIESKSNLIVSDHLTIIGNDKNAFFITFLGGKKHLIRVEIELDNNKNFISLKVVAEINKILKPNEIFTTEDVEIFNSNNISESIKEFALKKVKGIKVRKKQVPQVYCTWYYYAGEITYKDCLKNLDLINKKKLPLNVFQIDDGWENNIGDWYPNKKFPSNMKDVSDKITKHNLTPGIWTSPFIFEKRSKFYKEHRSWILKDKNNKPCIFEMNKTKFYILDITIEETWIYLEQLYKRLTYDFGFKYHKLDFTRAPITAINANYKNKYITIIEAYRNACLAIRKGMGDSFFLMCGGLYDPLIGIVDGQRSGSDVLSMWSAANRGGKTLPFTMKQSLLRYYMNYWWYNDPDAFVVRRNNKKYKDLKVSLGLLTDNEVKTSCINQLIGGGLFSMTEPLDIIDEDRLNYIFHILPIKKVEIKLIDIMNTSRYPNMIKINKNYLAIINYDDNNCLNKDITSKEIIGCGKGKINISIPPHGSTILKIEENKIIEINNKGHYLS